MIIACLMFLIHPLVVSLKIIGDRQEIKKISAYALYAVLSSLPGIVAAVILLLHFYIESRLSLSLDYEPIAGIVLVSGIAGGVVLFAKLDKFSKAVKVVFLITSLLTTLVAAFSLVFLNAMAT